MMGRKEKTDQQKSTLKRGKQNWLWNGSRNKNLPTA